MKVPFTPRQGVYLSFIDRYTARRGVAPSFEEIGVHFGTTAPSVNGMIKTLVKRGLLSRLPGTARSLRVLVPSAQLPATDFGGRRKTRNDSARTGMGGVDASDSAVTAVLDVMEILLPLSSPTGPTAAVHECARALCRALIGLGVGESEATEASRRITADASRWEPSGGGTWARNRIWQRREAPE